MRLAGTMSVSQCCGLAQVEHARFESGRYDTPNLRTNIIPTKIAWLKLSGKSPTDMKTPPL